MSMYVCMYVCPKIYIRRALSNKFTVTPPISSASSQTSLSLCRFFLTVPHQLVPCRSLPIWCSPKCRNLWYLLVVDLYHMVIPLQSSFSACILVDVTRNKCKTVTCSIILNTLMTTFPILLVLRVYLL